MRIEDRPDGALVLSERWSFLRWGALIAGGLLAAMLLVLRLGLGLGDARTLWAGGLVAVLALALAACLPDRRFVFEPGLGRLTWSVRRLIDSHEGVLSLADVRAVSLQVDRDADSRTRPLSYRVILMTSQGPMPLSSGREFDRDACEHLAARIRAMAPSPDDATAAGSVTAAGSRAS
jgi:hypothetical protein